ncbi:MAG: 2-phosphosulfolactate phosphatase [Dethiobacter sp.]|jgi:2-phosphosulfolactate phosphatase|nr:MAG: 2-phosphosulfolactate phosphatase [Dethiobacter sp.]
MFVDLILTHQQIDVHAVRGKICIVIDTLRATSTIITALSRGCLEIIPVSSATEALELKKHKYKNYLLGGEMEGQYLENFHLGNSPLEYCNGVPENKGLILSTTNGTRTLQKVKNAGLILICALLNVKTVGEWLSGQITDTVICCSGTRGNYSLEDFLTAGRLVTDLREHRTNFFFSDLAYTAACFYDYARKSKKQENTIMEMLKTTDNGQRLLKKGLEADINYCGQEDVFSLLPFYENGSIKTGKIP